MESKLRFNPVTLDYNICVFETILNVEWEVYAYHVSEENLEERKAELIKIMKIKRKELMQ